MKMRIAILLFSLTVFSSASADVVCAKVRLKNGKAKLTAQTVAGTACPKGSTLILNTALLGTSSIQGPVGPQGVSGEKGASGEKGVPGNDGAAGADGADGQLRIYGDGSAGAFVQSTTGNFNQENLQFSDFTVNNGVTLNVPSGTVIRCSGTFTNNGLISVLPSARQGNLQFSGTLGATTIPRFAPPHPGIARGFAETPEFGDASATRVGGIGGTGFGTSASFRSLLLPGSFGGGGGAARVGAGGGDGGGTIVILCAGALINNGVIRANASSAGSVGVGGGGGGVVILASKTSVTNSVLGSISANGGGGGNFFASLPGVGAGGGGGGGLVHLLAPEVNIADPNDLTVVGGTAGNAGTVTSSLRSGGGGGGGSIGNGGSGATVAIDGTTTGSPATSGVNGQILTTTADPTALF